MNNILFSILYWNHRRSTSIVLLKVMLQYDCQDFSSILKWSFYFLRLLHSFLFTRHVWNKEYICEQPLENLHINAIASGLIGCSILSMIFFILYPDLIASQIPKYWKKFAFTLYFIMKELNDKKVPSFSRRSFITIRPFLNQDLYNKHALLTWIKLFFP